MLLEIDKLCFDSSILEPRVAIKIMDSQVVFSQLGLSVRPKNFYTFWWFLIAAINVEPADNRFCFCFQMVVLSFSDYGCYALDNNT